MFAVKHIEPHQLSCTIQFLRVRARGMACESILQKSWYFCFVPCGPCKKDAELLIFRTFIVRFRILRLSELSLARGMYSNRNQTIPGYAYVFISRLALYLFEEFRLFISLMGLIYPTSIAKINVY